MILYQEVNPIEKEITDVCIQRAAFDQIDLNVKSNNYLLRSYIASESKARGGYIGIEKDHDGYLLEGTMATLAVLLKNGDFVIPPFDRILQGTTAIKIMKFLEEEVFPNRVRFLPQDNPEYINQIVRRDILVSECQQDAAEVMFLGGEECVPLLEWDGVQISDKKGLAADLFQTYLRKFANLDQQVSEDQRIKVNYHKL